MFKTLNNLKEKYNNSNSWKELLLSFVPGIDEIYKRLGEAKTDKERNEILNEALELQQKKIIELSERVKELEQENEQLRNISLNGLQVEVEQLSESVKEIQTLIELREN